MPSRFTEQELESFYLDPREPPGLARCPWCGGDIVLGVRKDTRNLSIAHQAHPDPTDSTGTRFVSGCEQFLAVLGHNDLFQCLFSAGARFQRLVPG